MKIKPLELVLGLAFLILAGLIGWLAVADISKTTASREESSNRRSPTLVRPATNEKKNQTERLSATKSGQLDSLLAHPKQRLVRFDNEKDYRKFLSSLDGSKLRLVDSLDTLRTALVSFRDPVDLGDLLDSDQLGLNYFVTLPLLPGDGSVQASAVGFGGNALEWLGITSENSTWGEGVTIAVIDSGITDHPALPENIRHIDLVEGEGTTATFNGHGTAVASLIAGTNRITPGVSPAASLIDVRITGADGTSSSFLLAEGIVAAVDAGADLINISLGSYGDSRLVRDAVDFAIESGAQIVSSSGNEGFEQPSYPAAYEEVIAVGAVDREGVLVNFSNTGEALDLTAPGLEVFSAWTEGRYIEFSGTSASAPYVTAAIATAMSEFNLNAAQAANYVLQFANEAGAPGSDLLYGEGHLDVGRVVNSETPGLFDIAAVSNLIVVDDGNTIVTTVQNQGTERIRNAELTLRTSTAQVPLRVSSLAPGEIQSFEVPTTLTPGAEAFTITSEVELGSGFNDIERSNNVETTLIEPLIEP